MMAEPMTREQVLEVVKEVVKRARKEDQNPDFRYADLRGVSLRGMDLHGANFAGADLSGADLGGTNFEGANFADASLMRADLGFANFEGADFTGADLTGANLGYANFKGSDLTETDLTGADLQGTPFILSVAGLPSGPAIYWPAPTGWRARIGCWTGTLTELQTLIDGKDWPDAEGAEQDRRRPSLQGFIVLAQAHEALWPDLVPKLAEA